MGVESNRTVQSMTGENVDLWRVVHEKRQESDPSFVKQEEERREDEGEEEKAWRGGTCFLQG